MADCQRHLHLNGPGVIGRRQDRRTGSTGTPLLDGIQAMKDSPVTPPLAAGPTSAAAPASTRRREESAAADTAAVTPPPPETRPPLLLLPP
ncbi:UNVERIFIED_CONTAM: hypothetical protein K2H54_051551 [Gekko kuhli]